MSENVIIIAEAGVNHNGDLSCAMQLVDAAADAKVDYVKFQTFKADKIVSKSAKKAKYQKNNTGDNNDSQYEMLKRLELSEDDHVKLQEYSTKKGVKFFSTAFDLDGLDYLNTLGFEMFKVPSGEITNYPYLAKLATFNKPVILSTGMANLEEINAALKVLTSSGLTLEEITVLHCNTEYPSPMSDVNLKAMQTIANYCGVQIGYSDHTLGIEVPIAAVALGAKVIEKHFTLDRSLPGPDHRASLQPEELTAMVSAIRNIELAMSGDATKSPSPSEAKNLDVARKSVFTSRAIQKDEIVTEQDLVCLRPGNGISPMKWSEIVGRKAAYNIEAFSMLKWEHLR